MIKPARSSDSVVVIFLLSFAFLFPACQTAPPASPGSGPLTLDHYLAVVNGNGGYLSFVLPSNGMHFPGPAVGAIYPQSVRSCGERLVVVNSSGNNLRLYGARTPNVPAGTIQFEPGTNPVEIAFADCETAYVSCYDAGRILKVDMASLSVAATLAVPPAQGSNPDGLAIAGGKLYVGLPGFGSGRTVGIVDLSSFSFTAASPVTVGENSQTLLVAGGRVHVLCTSGYNPDWTNKLQGSVHVIDPSTDQVERIVDLTGSDPAFGTAAENGRVFVSGWEGGLMCYDAATGIVLRGPGNPVARPASGGLMGLASSGSHLWACAFMEDSILEFDSDTFAATRSFPVGSQPGVLAFVP